MQREFLELASSPNIILKELKYPSIPTRNAYPDRILHIRLLARFSRTVMFLSISYDSGVISSMPPSCS